MKRLVSLLIAAVILVGLGVLLIPNDDSSEDKTKRLSQEALLNPPKVTEGGSGNQLDHPELAFLQNYEMTKDPSLGYPPLQRKIDAFAQIKESQRNQLASTAAIPGVEWIERGPDNVGGRTRAILFDPADSESKRAWAGATGGGLWVNKDITDRESEWKNVTGFIDNLAISSITYDPTNISTMYIGTGLAFAGIAVGDGIWKSTNAGISWNQLSNTADGAFSAVQDVLVLQSGTLFAASLNGLMRSTDGGDSWTMARAGDFADIEEAVNGDLYVSTGVSSNGQLFKSTDDGLTYADITPQSGGDRIEIATAPSNSNVVYAIADGGSGSQDVEWFVRSDDAGATWTNITIPQQRNGDCTQGPDFFTRGQAFFNLILAVHPLDEKILIAGGIDLHKTTNGGQDWNAISYWTGNACDDFVHADQHAIVFRPNFPNEAVFGNDGGLSYSSNVGDSEDPDFETRINKYNATMLYSVAMTNQVGSNIMISGLQDNNTVRFTEPGINSTRAVFGGDGALTFIDQTNPNIQMTAFVFNFIARSDNAGKSFTTLTTDQDNGRFINPADYDNTQGIYFSAGNSDQIKRIQGIKDNPQQQETITVDLNSGQISIIEVSPNVPKRVFVGTGSGQIFRIDSTHLAQMVVTPLDGSFDGTPGSFVSGIDIGTSDDQIAISFSNFGRTSVYETLNGGDSWRSREGNLPDIPVRDILYNPDNLNEVLLATELGVWSTTEFNSSNPVWEPTNSGLASVRVDKLEYREADKLVAAATHGRGLFTSTVFANTSIADFKANSVVGYAGVPVQFSDGSTRSEGDFSWGFGDGNTSTDQNPMNTYIDPGTYSVSLTINGGDDIETKTNYLTILPKQQTPYTLEDGGDFETDNGHFTGLSILHDVNLWERGSPTGALSQTSSGVNAWKTGLSTLINDEGFDYQSALYTPAFDLTDQSKDYTLKFKRSGSTAFSSGPVGLYVEYSIDGGINWQILGSSFNKAGQVNWYERGPNLNSLLVQPIGDTQMGWAEAGTPVNNVDTQVKLNEFIGQSNISFRFVTGVTSIFNGGYGVDGFMIDDFEITATDPTADFEANRTVVPENGSIQFTYTSNGAESFAWDFGDGNTSTQQNPIHSYESGGTYTVALTITSNGSTVTETKTDFITILPSISVPYLLADGGDFETNQNHFSAENIAGTPWELGISSISGKDGTNSGGFAWVTGIDENQYASSSQAFLITPSFVFDQPQEYIFEFKANFNFEDNFDGFIVEYSTDLGETYTKLNNNVESGWYTQASSANGSVFGVSEPLFSGNTGGNFNTFSTDVSFLYPNESVLFRFTFLTDTNVEAPGIAIDDFQLLAQTPEAPVANFTTSATAGCSGQAIVFTDASTGSVNSYQWTFGANASPATATGVGPHTVTYSGTGPSSPSLTVINNFNGEDTETKTDLITTSATHTPSITRGETSDPEIISLTASTGDNYQWFRNNQALTGETNQVLDTGEDGLYTVEVTINGCTVRAAALNVVIIVTGLEDDIVFSETVNLFPNPVQDELKISISNDILGQHSISFYTNDGRLMRQEKRLKDERDETFVFDITDMSQGNYLIQITSPKGTTVKKIIKQ